MSRTPVSVAGRRFATIREAAEHLGVAPCRVSFALRQGWKVRGREILAIIQDAPEKKGAGTRNRPDPAIHAEGDHRGHSQI